MPLSSFFKLFAVDIAHLLNGWHVLQLIRRNEYEIEGYFKKSMQDLKLQDIAFQKF